MRSSWHEGQLALPLVFFFLLFFIAPLGIMALISFYANLESRELGLDQYAKFLFDPFNLGVLTDTIWLGLKATIVCLVLGYPIAWAYTQVSRRWQTLIMALVIFPLLTSSVVRTFAWIVILGREGVVNTTLAKLALVSAPLSLLYTETGVVAALAQIWMPMMVLPVINSLLQIESSLPESSAALGAGPWRTFFKVTLPLTMPGIVAGCLLVFTLSATAFVVQSLVGGGRLIYMPLYMYQQAVGLQNWPFAAAVSIVFLVTILVIVYFVGWINQRSRGYA